MIMRYISFATYTLSAARECYFLLSQVARLCYAQRRISMVNEKREVDRNKYLSLFARCRLMPT